MHSVRCILAMGAVLTRLCVASPVPLSMPEVSLVEMAFDKRSEAGPEIGGVNFPDPSIINVNGIWYAFATRTIGSSVHIQIAQSSDYKTWSIVNNPDGSQQDALPSLPAWVYAASPNTWGPDVNYLDDGSFIMYYSATTKTETAKHCIGAATSKNVCGPYTPVGDTALICPLSQGGAIDSSAYKDNGKRYITYKVDGNSIGHGGACGNNVAPYVPTPIMLQAVAADGVTLQGSPTQILDNNGASDQGIVEAPSLVKSAYHYVLFFSHGCFTTGNYNVDYASSTSITGPYTRASTPLFRTGVDGLTAPGGADIYRDGKHLLFHANAPSGNGRAMYQAVVSINAGKVSA